MSDLYTSIKLIEEDDTKTKTSDCEMKNMMKRQDNDRHRPLKKKKNCIFYCTVNGCNKHYSQKYRLSIHLRTHRGEKPFECRLCEKNFTEKGNLKVHERIHSGERPYSCDYADCNKKFKAFGQLKDHKKIHSNFKEFVCEFCTKKFNRKSTLNMHILIHKDEKPFTCPYFGCEKKFREKSNMNKHCKTHQKRLQFQLKDDTQIFCRGGEIVKLEHWPKVILPRYEHQKLEIFSTNDNILQNQIDEYNYLPSNFVNLGSSNNYNKLIFNSFFNNHTNFSVLENLRRNSILNNEQSFNNYKYENNQDF